jgi:hypothetical protein
MGLIDDLRKFLGGSDQKLQPFQKESPSQRQALEALMSMSGGAALNQFRTNPGFGTGANAFLGMGGGGAAVALPFGKYKGLKNVMALNNLNRKADASQVLRSGPIGEESLRDVQAMLEKAPLYTGGATRKGRLYQLDPKTVRRSGGYTRDDVRMAIIQDPESGVMFASPGDFHHGELMSAAFNTGYRNRKAVPARGRNTRADAPKGDYDAWFQHEIWGPQKLPVLGKDIPGKVNWHIPTSSSPQSSFARRGAVNPDTRAATFGRMRLLRDLKKIGFGTEINEGARKVVDPQAVLKKWGIRSPRSSTPNKFPNFKPAKKTGPKDFQ